MVTKVVVWPGMDARWQAGWKKHLKNRKEWYDDYIVLIRQELDQYASLGSVKDPDADWDNYKRWEGNVSSQLEMYGLLKAFDLESSARMDNFFDIEAAEEIYAAIRLEEFTRLYIHIRAPERVGGQLSTMDIRVMPSVALGVVIGAVSALPLMRLLIVACRRGWYSLNDCCPIFVFMLLIAADFLHEALPEELTTSLRDSPLSDLLASWDNPDATVLVDLCIAASNFHTTRCRTGTDMEFANGNWCYTPVEMMLLMRLRKLRGLAIPQFEHPLWIAPFANFVSSEPPARNELMQLFEQRMRTDGFDEEFITQNVLNYCSGG